MLKILVACASGTGSSLMMKMATEKAFKELKIPVQEIRHCKVVESVSIANDYDLVIVPQSFLSMYDDAIKRGAKIISLKNIMSDQEIIEKFKAEDYYKLTKNK